jgi:hypothetical protein
MAAGVAGTEDHDAASRRPAGRADSASGVRQSASRARRRRALESDDPRLGATARDAILGRIRRLVTLTRETDVEHGLAFDAESGRQVGDDAVGERSAIELGPLLGAMKRDRAYAVVHTHPSDGPFSTRDVLSSCGQKCASASSSEHAARSTS